MLNSGGEEEEGAQPQVKALVIKSASVRSSGLNPLFVQVKGIHFPTFPSKRAPREIKWLYRISWPKSSANNVISRTAKLTMDSGSQSLAIYDEISLSPMVPFSRQSRTYAVM